MPRVVTKKDFITRANIIHNNYYTYNNVDYVDTGTKVSITCPKHGDFLQRPASHLVGRICKKCSNEKKHKRQTEKIFLKFNEVHGERYDYSQSTYQGMKENITIVCKKHGPFEIWPSNHIYGKQGCPLCGSGKRRTTKDFIVLAREVHGDRYDYSLVEYVNATTKIKIICPKHGMFEQTPDVHCYSNNQGCPRCKTSKGERKIYKTLVDLGIVDFVCEKTFDGLTAPGTKLPLKYDFYLPKQNILIEYDGQQHFEKVNFNSKLTDEEMEQRLKRAQQLDAIKSKYAEDNGYKLIRIPYWEYNKISTTLSTICNFS